MSKPNVGKQGYFRILNLGTIPVFVHWSFPLTGLLISVYFGFKPIKVAYYSIAYLILVGIHESGHMVAARLAGRKVFAIYISGAGGLCNIEKPRKISEAFLIFSAGLIAQILLFGITLVYLTFVAQPKTDFGECLAITFTIVNVLIFVINIIPTKSNGTLPTDGYHLWCLVKGNLRETIAPEYKSIVFSPDTNLLLLNQFVPDGFVDGIEILNDDTTPMDFVVNTLTRHLNKNREDVINIMLQIHKSGGILIPFPSWENARLVAEKISSDATEQNYPLTCRAVSVKQSIQPDAPVCQ